MYYLLFSVDQVSGIGLVGWLWLRASLEVAVKQCHRAAIISRLSEAERSAFRLTFTWLLADLSVCFLDDSLPFFSLGTHTHAQMHVFPILPVVNSQASVLYILPNLFCHFTKFPLNFDLKIQQICPPACEQCPHNLAVQQTLLMIDNISFFSFLSSPTTIR